MHEFTETTEYYRKKLETALERRGWAGVHIHPRVLIDDGNESDYMDLYWDLARMYQRLRGYESQAYLDVINDAKKQAGEIAARVDRIRNGR